MMSALQPTIMSDTDFIASAFNHSIFLRFFVYVICNYTYLQSFSYSPFLRDYQLSPKHRHYFVPDQVWRCKDITDKDNIYNTFQRDSRRKRTAGMITLAWLTGPTQ